MGHTRLAAIFVCLLLLSGVGTTVGFAQQPADLFGFVQKFIEKDQKKVRALQQLLADAGYYTGEIDGEYGPKTIDAVKNFQKALGHTQTGKLNKKEIKELKKRIAQKASQQPEEVAEQNATNEAAQNPGTVPSSSCDALEKEKRRIEQLERSGPGYSDKFHRLYVAVNNCRRREAEEARNAKAEFERQEALRRQEEAQQAELRRQEQERQAREEAERQAELRRQEEERPEKAEEEVVPQRNAKEAQTKQIDSSTQQTNSSYKCDESFMAYDFVVTSKGKYCLDKARSGSDPKVKYFTARSFAISLGKKCNPDIGRFCQDYRGVPLELIRQSARMKHPPSLIVLSNYYLNGKMFGVTLGSSTDQKLGETLLRQSAEAALKSPKEYSSELSFLGASYIEDHTVEEYGAPNASIIGTGSVPLPTGADPKLAIRLLTAADEVGNIVASYLLGSIYAVGPEKNTTEAIRLLEKAVEANIHRFLKDKSAAAELLAKLKTEKTASDDREFFGTGAELSSKASKAEEPNRFYNTFDASCGSEAAKSTVVELFEKQVVGQFAMTPVPPGAVYLQVFPTLLTGVVTNDATPGRPTLSLSAIRQRTGETGDYCVADLVGNFPTMGEHKTAIEYRVEVTEDGQLYVTLGRP